MLVNCLNGLYVANDPRDYGWKEDDGKFIPVWFEGDALPTPEEVETLKESTREPSMEEADVNELSDGYSSDESECNLYHSDSEYSDDDDCD